MKTQSKMKTQLKLKKLLMLPVTFLIAFSLSGCVIFHAHNTINDDGSGTAELTMSVSPSVAEAFAELKEMDPDEMQNKIGRASCRERV